MLLTIAAPTCLNPSMEKTIESLGRALTARFRPEQAHGVDMHLKLDVGLDALYLSIRECRVEIEADSNAPPDVTFLFDDLEIAWRILLGEANAIEAFMHGRFRADGYLMMAFRLMEMFGSASLPPTPHD